MIELKVNIIGNFPRFYLGNAPLDFNSKKAEALLIFLCCNGEPHVSRDTVANLLWGSSSTQKARDSLRQTIRSIRKAAPDIGDIFDFGRDTIKVYHQSLVLDVETIFQAVNLNSDSLDPSFELQNILTHFVNISTDFDDWLFFRKSEYLRQLTDAYLKALQSNETSNSCKVKFAQGLLRIDPTDEFACRFLMEHFAKQGETATALRLFVELSDTLEQDFDVEPSFQTIGLNAAIKLGDIGTSNTVTAGIQKPQSTQVPQIFVRNFAIEREADDEVGILIAFFRQALISNLARFRDWYIFESEPKEEHSYILNCQVGRQDTSIAVVVTLTQKLDRRIIWSQNFLVKFENWADTQLKIAQQLALAVKQGVSTEKLKYCLKQTPSQQGTFSKWILAQFHAQSWTPKDTKTALSLLDEVITEDSFFTPAYILNSGIQNTAHLVFPGVRRSETSQSMGLDYAQQALRLDPLDSNAHRVWAWACALTGSREKAKLAFQRSYDLNPTDLDTASSVALGFSFIDHIDAAIEIADQTIGLPVDLHAVHYGYFQNVYYLAGQFDKALDAGDRAGDATLNLSAWQAAIYSELGEMKKAKSQIDHFYSLIARNWHGPNQATNFEMLDWFGHCFPLHNTSKHKRLMETLAAL